MKKFFLPLGAAILTINDGQVLTLSRRYNPQILCFPGGRLDPGEHFIQAVVRELKEETGLIAAPNDLIPLYAGICSGDKQYETDYWVCAFYWAYNQQPILNPESLNPKFVDIDFFLKNAAFKEFSQKTIENAKISNLI